MNTASYNGICPSGFAKRVFFGVILSNRKRQGYEWCHSPALRPHPSTPHSCETQWGPPEASSEVLGLWEGHVQTHEVSEAFLTTMCLVATL